MENLNYLALEQLWRTITNANWYQLIAIVIIVFAIICFLIIVLSGSSKRVIDRLFLNNSAYDNYRWPTQEIIDIHILPDKLSLTPEEARKYKDMLLHKINFLRNELVSGKQFLISFEEVNFINEPTRNVLYELIDGAIKHNVVRLVFLLPHKPKKGAFADFCNEVIHKYKRYNKPASFSVKQSRSKIASIC